MVRGRTFFSIRRFCYWSPYISSLPRGVRAFSMTSTSTKPAQAWCCTASWNGKSPIVDTIAGNEGVRVHTDELWNKSGYDLTTSPDWMEYIELTEGRGSDPGGAGAYDTMRCDLIVKDPNDAKGYKIWGQDYHLERLGNSFTSLLEEANHILPGNAMETALEKSDTIIQALLQEADTSPFLKSHSLEARGEKEDENHTWIQMVKLTLLWSLEKSTSIQVRGHACSSARPIPVYRSVSPIVVTLAALQEGGSTNLPTRFQNPQSKVASWCRQRKKLEDPQAFKPPGVSEVLMMKQCGNNEDSSMQLLEGLSSNVFVVYKDGTLRTATDGVLFGYVRHLVLDAAYRCGLKVDTQQPILLQDAIDGKWTEVFITSSSRLIWPVKEILLPNEKQAGEFNEFWKDPVLADGNVSFATPQWQALLEDVLKTAGYQQ